MSCVCQEQTKQDQHEWTLEAAREKGHLIKRVTKVKERKQWKEVFKRNMLSMEFRYLSRSASALHTHTLTHTHTHTLLQGHATQCFRHVSDTSAVH